MAPQEIVVFVEGKGDVNAVPILAKRVMSTLNERGDVVVAASPFRVRGVGALVREGGKDWLRYLQDATKRARVVGVLLVLDGDLKEVPKTWKTYIDRFRTSDFCAMRAAAALADMGKAARAGELFSVATVFVMKEFEAWLLAGIEGLRGKSLAEGRGIIPANAEVPAGLDIEGKRDIKGVLRKSLGGVYSETLDQAELARHVDLTLLRQRCRSFLRFESAIRQLVDSARSGAHALSPIIV